MLPRRRRRLGIVVGGLLALQLSALVVLAWREVPVATHTTERVTTTLVTPPLLVPFAVEIARAPDVAPTAAAELARGSCPPARVDAPSLTPPKLDEDVDHVRVAPSNAGWVAAWNADHLFVSTDAGASFRRALDGPGPIRDVTFDCYGHVVALRAGRVGIRDGATEHWHEVPGIGVFMDEYVDGTQETRPSENLLPAALAGGGPDVIVVSAVSNDSWLARLAISHDLGRTWRQRDLASYFEAGNTASAFQDPDGTIHVAFPQPDCMSTGLWWATLRGDAIVIDNDHLVPGRVELYGDIALSAGQWKGLGADWKAVIGLPTADEGAGYPEAIPGAMPTIVVGTAAYRIANGRARKLKVSVSGEVQTVDRAGRIWTIVCGQPKLLTAKALETCLTAE